MNPQPLSICLMTTVHEAGDARIFHKEAVTLGRAGYRVTLLAPDRTSDVSQPTSDIVRLERVRVPAGRLARMSVGAARMLLASLRTRAAVCHLHDPELLPVGLLLKLRGRRVVYDVHEDYPQQVLSKHYLPRALRRPLAALLGRFEGAAARRLDAVVAATDHIAMRFGASTTVVRNYPALPGALPRRPRDHGRGLRVVHLAGTLTEDRGITSLVRALGLLDDSFELVLAGRFVPADYGRRLAALPGWSRVRHVPPVPHELVWDVYAGCDAGVVCLLPLPRYRVSLPVKLFEFMAAGLPVVASDFPLFRDIVERAGCGLCVDPESPEQIAAALRRLAAGPAAATAMGAAGRRAAAACYGWNAEADVLLGLYRRLLPPRRAPLARANARPTAALANEVSGV